MRPGPSSNATYDLLLELLSRYLSPLNAQVVLKRVIRELNLHVDRLRPRDIAEMGPRLERAARLFVDESKLANFRSEVLALAGPAVSPQPQTVPVKREIDISTARVLARRICEDLRATNLGLQKVATIVSELARNIVDYSVGGRIEIVPDGVRRRVLVRATDGGPGIKNLQEILSGAYRSRSGLGVGLLGSKRLSDRFDIESSPTGTRIEAEVKL